MTQLGIKDTKIHCRIHHLGFYNPHLRYPMAEPELLQDLMTDMPAAERFERIVMALHERFECGSELLLRLRSDHLSPFAIHCLVSFAHGRKFGLAKLPR